MLLAQQRERNAARQRQRRAQLGETRRQLQVQQQCQPQQTLEGNVFPFILYRRLKALSIRSSPAPHK